MRGGTVRRGGGVGLRALVVVAVAAAALVVARADTAAADGKLVRALTWFFFFWFCSVGVDTGRRLGFLAARAVRVVRARVRAWGPWVSVSSR
jgi:hypothetical protein